MSASETGSTSPRPSADRNETTEEIRIVGFFLTLISFQINI